MERVSLFNVDNYIQNTQSINLLPGLAFKARVLEKNADGLLLLIGENKVQAKTDLQISVGTRLSLLVISVNKDNIVLSLNNDEYLLESSPDELLNNLNLEATEENKKIISKFVEKKIKLSKDNIKVANYLTNQLPLEKLVALELITDPTLFSAIFNYFTESQTGFSMLMHEIENPTGETHYEINILYNSKYLGDILTCINWSNRLKINFFCSLQNTFLILQSQIEYLKKQLKHIFDLEINIQLDKKIFENITQDNFEKVKLKGIDIRI